MEQDLYSIFNRGLYRITETPRTGTYEISPEDLSQGSVFTGLDVGGTGAKGFHADKLGRIWSGAALFADAVFSVTEAGVVTASDLTLTGGTLKYGKTSFTDSTNAGYHISSSGVYVGSASDASVLKYTISSGVFDFIGTVSSRSTATIAATINSSGNVITDLINARLDTSAKNILASFSFGVSGAIQIGTYSAGVSGDIKLSPSGIVGRNSAGTNTFAINGTTGEITAIKLVGATGTIGGWTINATDLSATVGGNTTTLSSGATAFSAGPTATPTVTITQAGVLTATGASITGTLTATAGTIGGFTLSSTALYAGTAGTRIQLDTTSGIHLGATAFADAPFKVSLAGALTATSATITGALTTAAGSSITTSYLSGLVGLSNTNIAAQGWTQTSAFSVTDADTVAWGAGTLTTAAGTAYSIGAGNTGNMAARTYIYLDIAVSTTAYQTTTTASTAVGNGKILVATAVNGTTEARFQVFGGTGGLHADASDLLVANTVVAGLMSVSQLSAITADLGNITAGTIVLPSGGLVRSGQTAFDTGTGFYIGNDGGTPKFSFGNSAGNKITWNGSTLTIVGTVPDTQVFTADGTWTKPAGALFVRVVCVGAGGGGGGCGTLSEGASGGGGGAITERIFRASDLSATVAITVGTGGAGGVGAGQGSVGGTSSFGTYLYAYGGGGGNSNASDNSGGGGGGVAGAGEQGSNAAKTTGGAPASVAGANGIAGQGGGGNNNVGGILGAGGNAEYGGGAGGGAGTTGTGGSSLYGAGGGGAGGLVGAAGKAGGNVGVYATGGGGAGGATGNPGAVGTAGTDGTTTKCGTGGGGGGGNNASAGGGNGGAGGAVGGGGGGAGGNNGGGATSTGGAGGRGQVMVYTS